MIMKLNKWVVAIVIAGLSACGNNDVPTPVNPVENPKNIYPQPPSGWMGTTSPYNTTGWVGDIMPFFDNGKFHLFFLHDAQSKPAGQGFHDIHKFETSNLTD